jgi:hypothetical protein
MIEDILISSQNLTKVPQIDPLNHLLYDDLIDVLTSLESDFPDLVTSETIGHTYLNESLKMLTISSNPNGTGKALLITGPHHSRELSAIQVPLYVMLRIVQDWLH